MTEEINASETTPFDETLIAYAFCEFDTDSKQKIISGIIKDPDSKQVFKIIFSSGTLDIIVYSTPDNRNFYSCQRTVDADVLKILEEEDDVSGVNQLLLEIQNACHEDNVSKVDTEPKWKTVEEKYVTTFPLRGIGSLQWSKSEKIAKDQKGKNYQAACDKAEIISALLSNENCINVDEDKRIFKYLTGLEDFELDKSNGIVTVKHINDRKSFPLLKISEGIFEAKSISLLLAHKQFQTLCLEEPDKGMHPQMIERLRTVLHDFGFKKTIIVVTHSPYFIDSMTMDKTHVFLRTKNEPSVCSVLNIGKSDELLKVADIEIKRTLLFATRVLLLEGVTDKEVVQGILNEDKCKKLEDKKSSLKDFTDISVYQIISVRGCSNAARVRKFCSDIKLPCLCLLDLDAAVKFDIEQLKRFEDFDKDWQEMFQKTLASYEEEAKQLLEKLESHLKTRCVGRVHFKF